MLKNVEQLRAKGTSSVRQRLCLVEDFAHSCQEILGSVPKLDRRSRESANDVLQTIISLCERGRMCNAEEAIKVEEIVDDILSSLEI